ncbi:MAG: dihydrolipoyl dehydrogenase [Clostridiales bacterium]|nr:dihydrolipoyl dehydrogenase [Clostridiales bacterium]MDD7034754.1 dihydrolipoyl dehydrogenase [Bacillota bacterium]
MNKFDLIVIGAGPGGYVAAIKAAKSGMNVAIVESIRAGGTCLNKGCIPAKAMIHASSLYEEMHREAGRVGLSADNVSFDYGKIVEYKQNTTDELVKGIEGLLEANGITRIDGRGTLEKDGSVTVNGDMKLEADKVLLATGSVPSLIPIPGINLKGVVTSDGVFALSKMPESMVIIGGGVIGVEFATVYANLGARVTIIEALPRILQNMDKEISQNLKMIFKKKGIEIHTGASVKSIEEGGDGLIVNYEEKDKPAQATGALVVCAAGRKPNLEGLFGEGVEIEMDGKFVAVNDKFETSIPGVYAIGDIIKGTQLAHSASAYGICAVDYMNGREPELNLNSIPGCVYTSPEIAQVGITEADAKDAGTDVITGKFIMSANGKSLITHEERGFIKVVAEEGSHRILGAQMMCARATDMIAEFTTAIANDMTVEQLLAGVRPHPTYNEGITEALEDAIGEATHVAPKRRRK